VLCARCSDIPREERRGFGKDQWAGRACITPAWDEHSLCRLAGWGQDGGLGAVRIAMEDGAFH